MQIFVIIGCRNLIVARRELVSGIETSDEERTKGCFEGSFASFEGTIGIGI